MQINQNQENAEKTGIFMNILYLIGILEYMSGSMLSSGKNIKENTI